MQNKVTLFDFITELISVVLCELLKALCESSPSFIPLEGWRFSKKIHPVYAEVNVLNVTYIFYCALWRVAFMCINFCIPTEGVFT